nr:hypothetical protein [Methylobacterium sp. J-076]
MTSEVSANALSNKLGSGLAALASRSLDGSGEIGLDLQLQQRISSKR